MENKDLVKKCYEEAVKVRQMAYCPYSKFKVGCALIDQDDKMHMGCNVENASYGLSCCAERNTIFSAIPKGLKYIKLLVVIGDTKKGCSPCGACR